MAKYDETRMVNYVYLQDLKEENSSLWEDVILLGAYVQEPFSTDWIEQNAGNLLRRLRNKLSGQFRTEESLAYLHCPGSIQSRDVTRALDQHLRIVLHCIAISEQCDDYEYSGNLSSETLEIWNQMRELYEEIMEHESHERRMLSSEWSFAPFEGADSEPAYHSKDRRPLGPAE
jgi:hypothetical protein